MVAQQRLCRPPQVSFDWDLDSTVVFKAVAYLDHFLERQPVEALSRCAGPNVQVLQTAARPSPRPDLALPTNQPIPNCRPARRFQLLGLACLRAAMGDARKPSQLEDMEKKLDAKNFAYISDGTYTAGEVEAETQVWAAARGAGTPLPGWWPPTLPCSPQLRLQAAEASVMVWQGGDACAVRSGAPPPPSRRATPTPAAPLPHRSRARRSSRSWCRST